MGKRILGAVLLLAAASHAASAEGTWRDRFTDPEDGQFDMSNWLLDHKGVLPVPIIITEPAVGYGGGFAFAWFSESMREAAAKKLPSGRIAPPNVYALALAATENGTRFGGVGGRMSFVDDTWRWKGGVGAIDVNLDFYGVGGGMLPAFDKLGFNMKGYASFQEVTRRIGGSDHFVGGRWIYLDFDTKFDLGLPEDLGLEPRSVTKKGSGLGATYSYDSRDNIFFSTKGVVASVDGMFYSPSIGSDTKFQAYRGHVFAYIPATKELTVALRGDGRTARGDVPFYQYPFVDMRGVPAMRYQDESVGVTEIEARYYVTPRWIAVGFLGAARAWGKSGGFSDASTVTTKGVGFRYLIARRIGLAAGIDIARGPEDTAWYIQMGNAWR